MKVLLDWLNEFVVLPRNQQKLIDLISEHCCEVEKVLGGKTYSFSNIKIAKVINIEKHPNADRLRIVRLALDEEIVDPVVCGADNFRAGDYVALALPGATIARNIHSKEHENYILSKAKIRGIESQGMICSAFELGLSEKPEERPGILILKGNLQPGMDLKEHLENMSVESMSASVSGLDAALDLSIPANRPDLFSHFGIARELSTMLKFKQTKRFTQIENLAKSNVQTKGNLEVQIKNTELCPFYSAGRLKIKIKDSPESLKSRLRALGLRSVNNVVDITNYVMYEVGEPLHAFDSSCVRGTIVVRNAQKGEELTTIDHKKRALTSEILVIADSIKPLAIAGIMGGLESEITNQTTEIILEAANFQGPSIRRASKILGSRTEGSFFWEKGLSPEQAIMGFSLAVEMLKKYADAELIAYTARGQSKTAERRVSLSLDQINDLTGLQFGAKEIKKFISQLGFEIFEKKGQISFKAPYYRNDINDYADVAEEILKITGMNKIQSQPLNILRTNPEVNEDQPYMFLKERMVELGFSEAQNYSFVSKKDIEDVGGQTTSFVRIENPLTDDQAFLKQDLFIPLLKNTSHNSKFFEEFRLFEIGKGYFGYGNEINLLAFILYSKENDEQYLLAECKGMLESLLGNYFDNPPQYVEAENRIEIMLGGNHIGHIKIPSRNIKKAFEIEQNLVYAQVDLDEILKSRRVKKFKPYSKFPTKTLDISIVISRQIQWTQIEKIVLKTGGELIKDIEIFDADYLHGQAIPEFHKKLASQGLKNIAFHVTFGSDKRTLKDSEIFPIYDKITEELRQKLKAEIR